MDAKYCSVRRKALQSASQENNWAPTRLTNRFNLTRPAEKMAEGLKLDILVPPMPIEPALIIGAWHRKSSKNPFHTWVRNEVFELLRPLNEGEAQLPG
jgi:hypothetical protein